MTDCGAPYIRYCRSSNLFTVTLSSDTMTFKTQEQVEFNKKKTKFKLQTTTKTGSMILCQLMNYEELTISLKNDDGSVNFTTEDYIIKVHPKTNWMTIHVK